MKTFTSYALALAFPFPFIGGGLSPLATAGTLTVNSGASFQGSGTLNGDIEVKSGGTLSAGANLGCLSTGNINFESGAIFSILLSGTSACSSYDRVHVTGTVNLDNATLNVSTSGYSIQPFDSFTVLENDSMDAVNGLFVGLNQDSSFMLNGLVMYIDYFAGSGNDIALVYKYDDDNDGATNDVDAFPNDPSETLDTDGDGIGNNADWDDDGDGVPDWIDAEPLNAGNATELDLPLNSDYKGGKAGSGVVR